MSVVLPETLPCHLLLHIHSAVDKLVVCSLKVNEILEQVSMFVPLYENGKICV
jgi:hypothetical protein